MNHPYTSPVIEAVVSTIPQWYSAKHGPHRFYLDDERRQSFCRVARSSDRLVDLEAFVREKIGQWHEQAERAFLPGALQEIQHQLALFWLGLHSPAVGWESLLEYLSTLEHRTYEQRAVVLNLVLSEGEGNALLTEPGLQKMVDPLAASPHVYFKVDSGLRLLDYTEIHWAAVVSSDRQSFSPEFLQPFASILQPGEVSVHQLAGGDLVFLRSEGLIASRRKGRWQLYDTDNLARAVRRLFARHSAGSAPPSSDAARAGDNLLEAVLDLSYSGHGALLVFDPFGKVEAEVLKAEPGLVMRRAGAPEPTAHQALMPFVRSIRVGESEREKRKRRLFAELASLDGAVIFDAERIRAFGAKIPPNDGVRRGTPGTRTAAAQAAYHFGGLPVKISSDGEIEIYFESKDDDGECLAVVEFI